MGKYSVPRHGSMMYRRNRADSELPRIRVWPEGEGILGFAGYKAGLTHALVVENRKGSALVGRQVRIPVTVLEVPPMVVVGYRAYQKTGYGFRVLGEVWAEKLPKYLDRRVPVPTKPNPAEQQKKIDSMLEKVFMIRLITSTQPERAQLPKKRPDMMEQALGGDVAAQLSKAKDLLGKELPLESVFKPGDLVDVFAISKGHGFQGVIKRFGVKLQKRKTETKRKIGTLGPETPDKVLPTVPMAGQMGYHQRFSLNHQVLKSGQPFNPSGGWTHYGIAKENCVILWGSVPGPIQRLVRLRKAVRKKSKPVPEISFISIESKN